MDLITLINSLPVIGEKAAAIYFDYTEIYDINNKYPVFLRPLITFSSMSFMLPNPTVLFPFIYIAIFSFFIYSIKKVRADMRSLRKNSFFLRDVPFFLAALTLVITMPMILPGYSNGKYYIFLVPFLILFFRYFYSKSKIFYFIVFLNFLIFGQLFLGFV
jgi:hypothetical protein